MDLRSTRSRSKTPFAVEKVENSHYADGVMEETIIRTTRSSILKTYEDVSSTNVASERSERALRSKTSRADKASRNARYKTSDYSSEDGDSEVTTSHTISENERNQIIEDARQAANGDAEISALGLYRKAGRYWEKYPKTDWTYSQHSKDRVEIAPGVVQMPNMSRRSLHSQERSTEHLFAHKDTNYISNNLVNAKRALFTNNRHELYEDSVDSSIYKKSTYWSKFTSVFVTLYTSVVTFFYYIYRYQSSTLLWFGKKFHRVVSKVMLWDTWLLRGDSHNKLQRILLLCLVPLILFGGWWLLSSLGQGLYGAIFNSTQSSSLVMDESASIKIPESIEDLNSHNVHVHPEIISEDVASSNSAKLTSEELETIILSIKNSLDTKGDLNHEEIKTLYAQFNSIQNTVNLNVENIQDFKDTQSKTVETLKTEINQLKLKLNDIEASRNEDFRKILANLRAENSASHSKLLYQLNRCCRRSFINIETHVTKIITDLFKNPEFLSNEDVSKHLKSIFVAKDDLEQRLSNLTQNLQSDIQVLVELNGNQIMREVVSRISEKQTVVDYTRATEIHGDLTDEHIKRIVQDSLAIYDADKTGLVDYAMEPMGGQVLSTRCTESYQTGTAVVSILGIPLWYPTNTPRTVITPGINPGECWAFQNFPGFLVIKLAMPIQITAFSYEHISKKLVPGGKIDSAPKAFEVYGLRNETDKDPLLLGSYKYDVEGEPLQFFISAIHGIIFDTIELRVLSNHGNPNYTCLYRFRVHGSVSGEPT